MAISSDVLNDAMELSPAERAELVNELLASLNQPDEDIDDQWRTEVKRRRKACEEGKIDTVSLDEVLSKYQS
jgi:putative addiction module component (TIGR02574 family)